MRQSGTEAPHGIPGNSFSAVVAVISRAPRATPATFTAATAPMTPRMSAERTAVR